MGEERKGEKLSAQSVRRASNLGGLKHPQIGEGKESEIL